MTTLLKWALAFGVPYVVLTRTALGRLAADVVGQGVAWLAVDLTVNLCIVPMTEFLVAEELATYDRLQSDPIYERARDVFLDLHRLKQHDGHYTVADLTQLVQLCRDFHAVKYKQVGATQG